MNNDEIVSPLDALALATEWGRTGPGPLNTLAADAHRPMVYVDVDGDGALSIQDFDAVVAYLNGPVHRSDAAGNADGEAGRRGPDENPPSSSRFPRAVSASRHDAGVQLNEDLIFAIDVGNGPTRQFQLMRAGVHNQAHASGGSLDAASDRLQADVPASRAATDGRADRYHDQAAERIERAGERLLGRDFARANARLLRSLPVIDQLAGALAAGEGTSVRAGKVAGRSMAAWSLAGAGRAAASAAAGEGEYWNTPPVAEDDYYDLLHDTEISESAPGVMWNDWDDDGDTITAVLDQGPTNHDPNDPNSFQLNADGSFFYRPKRDWAGEDQFTYYVTDGNDVSGTAIVRLYVHNTPPWAEDDHYEMVRDSTLDEPAPGVLGNDMEDDDDPLTAMLVSGPSHADTFAFDSDGSFSYTPSYHYVGQDTFTYHASDGIDDSETAIVTIQVMGNEFPVADAGGPYPMQPGDRLYLDGYNSYDPDPGPEPLSYGWDLDEDGTPDLSGPAPSVDWSILESTYGYTANSTHTVSLTVTDGADSATATAQVAVAPSMNPTTPTDTNAAANNVAEGAANGTAVGITASSTDPNGSAVTYSLTNNAGGRFAIDANSGVVTVANGALLDFESATSHSITVQARDGSGGTASQDFTINVTNMNPTTPTDSNAAANNVAEGSANGTAGGITADSIDPNGPAVTYSLTNDAGGRFAIDANSGVVTVANGILLNSESATSHIITVQANDGSGGSASQDFTINVTNVDPSTPTDSNAAANEVAEGSANGTAVGITAHSIDPNGPAVTYSLTNDAGGRFAIGVNTGVVTVADDTLLDYESAASHTITVEASDGSGGTSTQNFTVSVTNVDPSTPTDSNAAANEVAEGAANGTTIGITADSTDPNGPSVTYNLTNNAGGRFTIDPGTGVVTVANGILLDYETATSHDITVEASDGSGGTSTQNFTINVTNVDPTVPTDADAAADSIRERPANGATVGVTASSTDPNGPAVTYSLTGNAGGRFTIDPATGVVTVANRALLNYEDNTSHDITVEASDGSGGTSTETFTINVTNIAPTIDVDKTTALNQDFVQIRIGPDRNAGDQNFIIAVEASDPNGAPMTFAFTQGNGEGMFAIDSSTGKITLAKSLSSAQTNLYDLFVTATDCSGAGGLTDTGRVVVTIMDTTVGVAGDTQAIEGTTDVIDLKFVRYSNDVSAALTVQFTVNWVSLSAPDLANGAGKTALTSGSIVIPAGETEVRMELIPVLDPAVGVEGLEYAWVTVDSTPDYAVVRSPADPKDPEFKKMGLDVFESAKIQVLDGVTLWANGRPAVPPNAAVVDPGGVVDINDINQAHLGDCWFLAAVAALAQHNPGFIQGMISENVGTPEAFDYTVQFPGEDPVTVQFELTRGLDQSELSGDFDNNGRVEIWTLVLEMAFAQANEGYDDIDGGGHASDAWEFLTGQNASEEDISSDTDAQIRQKIQDALNNNQVVMLGAIDDAPDIPGHHAYYVTNVLAGEFELFNPWGRYEILAFNRLSENLDWLYIGDVP